jgi:hypothetical protein
LQGENPTFLRKSLDVNPYIVYSGLTSSCGIDLIVNGEEMIRYLFPGFYVELTGLSSIPGKNRSIQ